MSDSAPNEPPSAQAARAYGELTTLVRHLADELAGFRRRAFAAEGRLRELEAGPGAAPDAAPVAPAAARPDPASPAAPAPATADDRVAALERENAELRRRVEQASARTRQLLERVRFLRQQHVVGG